MVIGPCLLLAKLKIVFPELEEYVQYCGVLVFEEEEEELMLLKPYNIWREVIMYGDDHVLKTLGD